MIVFFASKLKHTMHVKSRCESSNCSLQNIFHGLQLSLYSGQIGKHSKDRRDSDLGIQCLSLVLCVETWVLAVNSLLHANGIDCRLVVVGVWYLIT